jgi:hypothetical protein
MSCQTTSQEQHIGYDQCSVAALPWPARDHVQYLEQMNKQLIKLSLQNDSARDTIVANLMWLQGWPWGRSIKTNAPQAILDLGLKPGDKIVPCYAYLNPHDLDTAARLV